VTARLLSLRALSRDQVERHLLTVQGLAKGMRELLEEQAARSPGLRRKLDHLYDRHNGQFSLLSVKFEREVAARREEVEVMEAAERNERRVWSPLR